MIQPKSAVVQLPVYQPGKSIEEVQKELGLTEIIKLASNENPLGCSPKVQDAIQSELNQLSLYPDGASAKLTAALAQFYRVSENQLIIGAGSDEIITMIARAYLQPGDENIMASHTFPQYRHNAEVEGAVSIVVPLKDGAHDLDAMLAKVNERTKILWICNPNNPTGTIVSHEQVEHVLRNTPSHVMVVLDEAYCEYVGDKHYPDGLALLQKYENLVLLRTFSKAYGLAALRVGYGIANPEIIRIINQVRGPFNTTRLSQAAAIAALDDQAFIEQCRQQNSQEIQFLNEQFARLGFEILPAHGNFIMVDVHRPASMMFQKLLTKGVIIRGGHQLDFPTSLRITVGTRKQNEFLIRALEQVIQEVSIED